MPSSACYPEKSPKVDRLLDTLSDNLRREIVTYFENECDGDGATVDELVAHVAGRVPEADREELALAFVHNQLPKLQSRGWLDFDARTERVRYHGHDSAEQLLTDVAEVFAG